tara:strand:+ start:61 stop:426 length:366 start_codon:yes stop_codon:yes gene_type:complete
MNDLYIQPEDNPNMLHQIPRSQLLSKIDELEDHYQIDMQKDLFESNLIPLYFNVKQINLNSVVYEFEVDEGSAQITVINFNSAFSETWETNEVLDDHCSNLHNDPSLRRSRHDAFKNLDSL